MKIGRQLWTSAFAVAAMLALAAGALFQTTKSEFAVRWDLHGHPFGFLDARLAVLIVPLTAVALSALFAVAPRILPPRSLDRSAVVWTAVWTGMLIALFVAQAAVIALNLGVKVNTPRLAAFIVAGMFAFIGNYMGKIRYNFAIGLRTPWTLSDERVWDKTHRFLGRAMVAGAVLLAAATFLTPMSRTGDIWILVEIGLCAFTPPIAAIVYSARVPPPAPSGTEPLS